METKILICRGCLAVSRKLTPLKDTWDLFFMLLGDKEGIKFTEILLCWECIAYLRRMKTFQRQIKKAHFIFRNTFNVNYLSLKSLSTLSIVQKNTYEFMLQYNEEVIEQEPLKSLDDWVPKEEKKEVCSDREVDIKEEYDENTDNTDNDIDAGDRDDTIHENIKVASPEEEKKNKIESKIKKEKVMKIKKKYEAKTKVTSNHIDFGNVGKYFIMVTPTEDEMNAMLERDRNDKNYLRKRHKCMECAVTFKGPTYLKYHNQKIHRQNKIKSLPSFLQVYKCELCGEICRGRSKRKHLKVHAFNYTCRMCDIILENKASVMDHYKQYHTLFICDYCGMEYKNKSSIEGHIGRKHGVHKCPICLRKFDKYRWLRYHIRKSHTSPPPVKSELAYCVECDRQFDSEFKYRRHLTSGTKHSRRPPLSIPCPKCGKTFTRRCYMNNHFKLFHVKCNQHYCEYCNKYYVTAYALRVHKLHVHDKVVAPKNKICNVCHRGFSTNRILVNHMRTHTGERPFACPQCTATFAQKTALHTHMKALHKILMKKSQPLDD